MGECASTGRGLVTGSSHWSFKMLATFLDLWKQWQGANQNRILNKGKGVPTRCQSPFHVRQHGGAIHTFGLRSAREPGELAGATAAGDTRDDRDGIMSLRLHATWEDPSTQDGPLNQPDTGPGLQHTSGPCYHLTRAGRTNARAGRASQRGPSRSSLPRVTNTQSVTCDGGVK